MNIIIKVEFNPDNISEYQYTATINLIGTKAEIYGTDVTAQGCNPGEAIENCYRLVGVSLCLHRKE